MGNHDDSNCYTVGAIHTINDESDYAYNIPSPKLGDAMLNEDDLFSPLTLNDQICYDDCMPSIYDENKVATYDDYCDDTYVIKSSDDYIYKTCHDYDYPFSEHYSFNVETIYSIRVSYDTPTIVNEKKFSYVESNKISMLVDHGKMLYVMVILMNLFMMLLKIIMREELMIHDALVMFQSLSFMRASMNSSCLA